MSFLSEVITEPKSMSRPDPTCLNGPLPETRQEYIRSEILQFGSLQVQVTSRDPKPVESEATTVISGPSRLKHPSTFKRRLPFWLPVQRNLGFVGREALLGNLLECLRINGKEPTATSGSRGHKTAVLCGLGGSGKTQLAINYSHC